MIRSVNSSIPNTSKMLEGIAGEESLLSGLMGNIDGQVEAIEGEENADSFENLMKQQQAQSELALNPELANNLVSPNGAMVSKAEVKAVTPELPMVSASSGLVAKHEGEEEIASLLNQQAPAAKNISGTKVQAFVDPNQVRMVSPEHAQVLKSEVKIPGMEVPTEQTDLIAQMRMKSKLAGRNPVQSMFDQQQVVSNKMISMPKNDFGMEKLGDTSSSVQPVKKGMTEKSDELLLGSSIHNPVNAELGLATPVSFNEVAINNNFEAPKQVFDLGNVNLENNKQAADQLMNQVANYISVHRLEMSPRLDMQFVHQDLGQVQLSVEKAQSNGVDQVNIMIMTDNQAAKDFFVGNQDKLVGQLGSVGIGVSDFSIENSSFNLGSTAQNSTSSEGGSNSSMNQDSQQSPAQQREQQSRDDGQRRRQLWDYYKAQKELA